MAAYEDREVLIIGGGLAGLSAAIYLGRAMRDVVVVDARHSMAVWEPEVQNYLGFDRISGKDLLERGRRQAEAFGAALLQDEILEVARADGRFLARGRQGGYRAERLLLATGIFHIPPDIPGVAACLGHSMFFCKDCDGYRVQGQTVAILGSGDEAIEYALGMLAYSPRVIVATNGEEPVWDEQHEAWRQAYDIPVHEGRVVSVEHEETQIRALRFEGGRRIAVDCLFATRGDLFHVQFARALGAELDHEGQIKVDADLRTTVAGVYAAGCVTPANCQMIIAAGQGATAAQAINRDLFEESLANGTLLERRGVQIRKGEVFPEILE